MALSGELALRRAPGAPVDSVRCQVFRVPTDRPEADGTLEWSATTAVVVEVGAGGTVGLGLDLRLGRMPSRWSPRSWRAPSSGPTPWTYPGPTRRWYGHVGTWAGPAWSHSAISAVDIALWDLKARLLGVALSDLFGRCRDDAPVYGSGGFTTYDDATLSSQLERWVGELGDTTREDQDR